eukprot:3390979-Amphidinium_carterae.1
MVTHGDWVQPAWRTEVHPCHIVATTLSYVSYANKRHTVAVAIEALLRHRCSACSKKLQAI